MRRAVIWLGIILAALLACGPLVAGPPYAGATAEQYDWQGTWESFYKKEITGPSFPWAFTRIKDAFQANFSFSMDASGKVRGEAHGSIFYRFEYDGCASISQNSCVTRCKGEGVVEGNTGERGFPIPPHPGIYPRYVPDMSFGEYAAIPVTGQLNGTTVHLKLGPPDYLVPFDTTSTCVGPMGTQTNTTTMSWFCPAGSYLCAPSAMFLEIDMPLAHEAAQPIHEAEVGGGLDGMVRLRHTCRSAGDGERGFVYVSANSTLLHKEPAANSPNVGGAPWGARLVFTNMLQKNGMRWYYIAPPGGNPGWVPASDVSCVRPAPHPPGKPLRLEDTGLGNEHPAASMTTGGAG